MGMKEYLQQIEIWRAKYGTPPTTIVADPTMVQAGCARCKKLRKRSSRHHKGNDMFFARLMPDYFAKRYIEFYPDDVTRLCNQCHRSIHEYMHHEYSRMLNELNKFYALPTIDMQIAWCNHWRSHFRRMYEQWLTNYKPRSPAKQESKNDKKQRSGRKSIRKNRTQSRRPKG